MEAVSTETGLTPSCRGNIGKYTKDTTSVFVVNGGAQLYMIRDVKSTGILSEHIHDQWEHRHLSFQLLYYSWSEVVKFVRNFHKSSNS